MQLTCAKEMDDLMFLNQCIPIDMCYFRERAGE